MDALYIATAIVNDWPTHQVLSTSSFDVGFITNPEEESGIGWELYYINDVYVGG